MLSKKMPAFSLMTLLYVANVTVLVSVTTGCTQIFQSKTLSQDKAEKIINKWLGSRGTISNFKGVVQNENESTAIATLQISNFTFKDSRGNEETYSGEATAFFTRYTDGSWAMTKFITNPPNPFGATQWSTNVKEEGSEDN